MKKNQGPFSSDRMDRALVAFSLLAVLLCGIVLSNERVFQFLLGRSSQTSNAPVIGEISFARNDIRHRSADSHSWEKAKTEQRIRIGDSVFTGEKSQSQVALQNGGRVDLDQNSLVKFSKIDNIELPNLALGNFRVAVNGTMKIAIDGEVTEIEGQGSEVQVILKSREKPKLRLLKGAAHVKTKTASQKLESNQIVVMQTPAPAPMPVKAPAAVEPKVLPAQLSQPIVYTDELYDLFEQRSGRLVQRENRKTLLNFAVEIPWTAEGKPIQVFGQLSNNRDFFSIPDSFAARADAQSGTFRKTLLGKNFYRLSVNGKNWSEPNEFEIVAQPLDKPAPQIKISGRRLLILKDSVTLSGRIESELQNVVLEMSESPQFPPAETRVTWMSEKKFVLHVSEPKSIFLRARAVDPKLKVTDVSSVVRVDVEKPALPEVPRLAESEIRVLQGDDVNLSWTQSPHAKKYHVQVLDSQGKVVAQKSLEVDQLRLRATTLGTFRVKVASEDAYGRISKQTNEGRIVVNPKPAPILAKRDEPERKPASTATLTEKVSDIPDYLNKNYPSSKVSFETAAFTMYSQDQIENGKSNPTAMMMGVRWMSWMGSQGLETSFLMKVVDINSAPGGDVNPMQAEARYHYRWTLPFNPFSKFDQSQISLIGGYEYYHNSGRGLFSPGYQLLKGGFSLAFPLLYRWDTGGEILYGQGLESSRKYEISGYLNYYWDRRWSLGVGYRIHLFEAGSNGASPLGIPYREGFGEGYSVVRWHY